MAGWDEDGRGPGWARTQATVNLSSSTDLPGKNGRAGQMAGRGKVQGMSLGLRGASGRRPGSTEIFRLGTDGQCADMDCRRA